MIQTAISFSVRRAACLLAVLLALSGGAWADVVDDMKSLIEQGRYADAFNLGMRNDRLAGDPRYDYFFGVAAVDSGRASLGVLALERVLLDNPGNDLARLELARGYFVVGDYERAREEFEFIRGRQLPPNVRASVERYLNAIREADPQFRITHRTFIEYGVGYNSNVNSATSAATVDIPSIGPITLSGNSSPSPSALTQLTAGTQIQGPVSVGLKYLIGLEANVRGHAQRDLYDQSSLTGMGGLDYELAQGNIKASVYSSQVALNQTRFRDTNGLVLDWSRPLDKEHLIRVSLNQAELRYGKGNEGRDADLTTLSLGLNRYLGGAWRLVLDVDANLGQEKSIKRREDFSRDITGLRLNVNFYPGGHWIGSAGASYSNSAYKGADPLFGVMRSDQLYGLDAGLQYQLTRGWLVRGELSVLRNQSNLELYSYTSVQALLKFRYEWK